MAYVDFGYYQDFFKGKVITDLETFRTLAERSTEYVDMVTFCNINTEVLKDKSIADRVKRCCCAVAEAYYLYDTVLTNALSGSGGTGAKTSESIGQYSITWADPTDSLETLTGGDFPSYLRKLCLKYLGCTGLMFRGVCY